MLSSLYIKQYKMLNKDGKDVSINKQMEMEIADSFGSDSLFALVRNLYDE